MSDSSANLVESRLSSVASSHCASRTIPTIAPAGLCSMPAFVSVFTAVIVSNPGDDAGFFTAAEAASAWDSVMNSSSFQKNDCNPKPAFPPEIGFAFLTRRALGSPKPYFLFWTLKIDHVHPSCHPNLYQRFMFRAIPKALTRPAFPMPVGSEEGPRASSPRMAAFPAA